jgi:chitinase
MRTVFSLVTAALMLASCGGGDGGGREPPPPPPPPPPVSTVAISITPATVQLESTETSQFNCSVTGNANTACTWHVQEGAAGGAVSPTGLYVAPPAEGTYHVVATSVADTSKTATATITVRRGLQEAGRTWVTGYYSAIEWPDYPPQNVDMAAMTHFVFRNVAPGSGSGGGEAGDIVEVAGTAHVEGLAPDGDDVQDYLVRRAHQQGAKAILMVGGEHVDEVAFIRSTSDAVRGRFVSNILAYLSQHDYDGVDLYWPEVEGNGREGVEPEEAQRRLRMLITDLRQAAADHPRYRSSGIIITLPAPPVNIGLPQTRQVEPWRAEIANLVDQYNLTTHGPAMAWNAEGRLSWFAAPITGAESAMPYDLVSSINAYILAGVDQWKVGIGVGFYGVYYGPSVTGPRQSLTGNTIFEMRDTLTRYRDLVRRGYLSQGTYHWDDIARVGYRSYGNGGYVPAGTPVLLPAGFLSYEDELSIAIKGRWVRDNSVGGTTLWTINHGYLPETGTNPLLTAAKRNFLLRQ